MKLLATITIYIFLPSCGSGCPVGLHTPIHLGLWMQGADFCLEWGAIPLLPLICPKEETFYVRFSTKTFAENGIMPLQALKRPNYS